MLVQDHYKLDLRYIHVHLIHVYHFPYNLVLSMANEYNKLNLILRLILIYGYSHLYQNQITPSSYCHPQTVGFAVLEAHGF